MKSLIYFLSFAICFLSFSFSNAQSYREKLSDAINSDADELAPYITNDGKTLFFVRSFHPENLGGEMGGQDIWISTRYDDNTWSEAKNIGAPVNNVFNNSICGVSEDGTKIFLTNVYVSQKKMKPGLSYSKFENGKWSFPERIKIKSINLKKGFFGFHFSADESLLILSYQDESGFGEEDLYVSLKETDGTWSKPLNLGNQVNTGGFEFSPFLAPDHKTLYFCSNGFDGYGEGDIYVTRRLDDSWTNWSEPENLGPKVNTTGLDSYLSINEKGEAFFVSGEQKDDLGDIYTFQVFDLEEIMDTTDVIQEVPIIDSIIVKDTEEEEKLDTLKYNIFFDFDSYKLTSQSESTLNEIINIIEKNKRKGTYIINIIGYTDVIGPASYNQVLSEKRAGSVKEFLIKKDVQLPLNSKGSGEFDSSSTNRSEEVRQKHRKVTVTLIPVK